jgi:hypothetical protein
LVLTNTNSTNPLKGGGLFQLLSSYVRGGVLYRLFFNKVRLTGGWYWFISSARQWWWFLMT